MAWGDLGAATITADFTYPDGTGTGALPTSATVRFEFPDSLLSIRDPGSNLYIVPRPILGRMDGSGFLKLPGGAPLVVPFSDDPDVSPTGWTYHVTVTVVTPGATGPISSTEVRDVIVSKDAGTTQDLADLITVTPLGGFDEFATLAQFNELAELVAGLASGSAGISPTFSKAGFIAIGPLHGGYPAPGAFTIHSVKALLTTAPVGGNAVFDVYKDSGSGPVSIFTNPAHRPTIAAGTKLVTSVAPEISHVSLDDVLTAAVVATGSPGTEGSDLTLLVVVTA